MKYKHIIWDWNGTLIDDRRFCIDIMNEVLKKRQMETMTEEWFLDNFCFPVKDYYLKLGFNFEKEPFDISGTEFINKYMERCHELQLHQGATDVLEYLKNLDVPQSLLSASSQVMLNQILKNHDLNDYFTTILGADNHYAYGKETLTIEWIKKLEHDPKEVLFIGDTIHDKDIADKVGSKCLLISKGHVSKERLIKTGAPVFENIISIIDWIIESK